MFLLLHLLFTTICFGAYTFDSHASYSTCDLYYDFSRGSSNRISVSPFSQNAFVGQIINNNYFDIADSNTIIGSNSVDSYSQYTVIFDAEFPEIFTSGDTYGRYLWGADSTMDVNTGGYNGQQYHFLIRNGKLAIENWNFGPEAFSNSPLLITNQRYLISYVVTETQVDLYIDGTFIQTLSVSNGGVYTPYYIKVGGSGHANRPHQKIKLYQYAFYGQVLTSLEITELATTTSTPTSIMPTTMAPSTLTPTTMIPTKMPTNTPSTAIPTTMIPTTNAPTTTIPTTMMPSYLSTTSRPITGQSEILRSTIEPTKLPSSAPSAESHDAEIISNTILETTSLRNGKLNDDLDESLTFSNIYVLIILLSVTCVLSCFVIICGLYLLRKKNAHAIKNRENIQATSPTTPNQTGMTSNASSGSVSVLNAEPVSITPKVPITMDNITDGELNTIKIIEGIKRKHSSSQVALDVPLPMEKDENVGNDSDVRSNANKHMFLVEKVKSVSMNDNENDDSSEDDGFNDDAYTKGGGNITIQ